MSKRGWFAFPRHLFEDESFKEERFTEREAFVWLISEASYERRTVRAKSGRGWVPVQLERGEVCHAYEHMAKQWRWTYKRVINFIKARKRWAQIDCASGKPRGTDFVIISIRNYDRYRATLPQSGMLPGNDPGTHGARFGQQDKQLNKSTKKTPHSEEPEGFAECFQAYPRKTSRKAAELAYRRIIAGGSISAADLLTRTKRYAESVKSWPKDQWKFIPYFATWLDSGRYLDEPETLPQAADAPTIAPPERGPEAFSRNEWHELIVEWKKTGRWNAYWGPSPGSPGCLAPPDLFTVVALDVGDAP